MPGFNWRECQGEVPVPGQATGGGWRTQLPPGSRHRIVDKILEILKNHLPFSEEEELQDLEETALRFEESIFTTATSQSDYLRKISLKMLGIEMKSHNLMLNYLQSNAASASTNFQDPEVAASMQVSDWRSQLHPNSRTRIVNKIVETLKMYLPLSGLEGALEIERIAVRFEEKIHSTATSQMTPLCGEVSRI
ncbi:uncharacterized protein LOC130984975 isoform X2 [Salvia miltiorrhiza]|uniref:uncharacterized protein LOC130984975 isoform X2 n=1 Tax=Salvia miltiorrhiza TaxID=226208 RepID=UPI0025ABD4A8|nr:uncharacterized protein LOC130984975 isoform X2 [Salvia miltiorrhiza]